MRISHAPSSYLSCYIFLISGADINTLLLWSSANPHALFKLVRHKASIVLLIPILSLSSPLAVFRMKNVNIFFIAVVKVL